MTAGSSSGGDSFPTPQKLRTSASTGSGFRDDVVSKDDDDEDDDDDESITLDQFLKECNKSPKSRVSESRLHQSAIQAINLPFRLIPFCRTHAGDGHVRLVSKII